jgi:hypothetical protein
MDTKPYDVFLAHNSGDKPAVEELARVLRDERRLKVWFDVWKLRPGLSWQKGMEDGIRGSKSGAVLVGRDGIGPWENEEMEVLLELAVREQRPVIPVLLPGAAEKPDLPVFLASRHYVDLRGGLSSDSVDQLVWGITGENPHDRPDSSTTSPSTSVDISRIVKYAPPKLIGREQETALLDKTLAQMKRGTKVRPRVLTFVALGGEGKTSLVAKWVDGLDQKDWPGCEAAFAWSFYSQGSREQVAVSSDLFLAKALEFFGDAEMAASAQGAFEKGQRLARLVGDRKSVLVLDGLEPLQFPPHSVTPGKLKDQGIEALLSGLARHSAGLCVVTTRFEIADVKSWPETAPQHELLRLSKQAGVEVLQSIGVQGSLTPGSGISLNDRAEPLNEYEALVEDVDGHALTLQILGQYLVRAHRGDIRRRDRIDFATAEARIPGGPGFHADHAFRAIAAYEAWLADDSEESRRELAVLRLLGLFDRPATADCVQALLEPPAIDGLTDPLVGLSDEDREFTLTTLSDARLVSVNRAEATGELFSLDAHPLIRENFALRLLNKNGVAGAERSEPLGSFLRYPRKVLYSP